MECIVYPWEGMYMYVMCECYGTWESTGSYVCGGVVIVGGLAKQNYVDLKSKICG